MVGAHLSFLYKDEEEREKFLSVITDAEWGIQLGKLGVSAELMQVISLFKKKTQYGQNCYKKKHVYCPLTCLLRFPSSLCSGSAQRRRET